MIRKLDGKMLWVVLGIVILLSALLGAALLNSGQDWGDDFASYILQAQSIVHGNPSQFIQANAFTIHQSSINLGPVAYPWGTPVLLAPVIAVFGVNMIALKTVNLVCYVLFLILLAAGLRSKLSPLALIGLVGLLGVDPPILALFNTIASDVPFLLVSTAAILLIGWVIVQRRILGVEWLGYVLLGIALAASFFIRTTGIVLLFVALFSEAIASLSAFRRDRPPAASPDGTPPAQSPARKENPWRLILMRALPYLVFLGLAGVWYLLLPSGEGGYLQSLKSISIREVKANIEYYIALPQNFFSAIPFFPLVFGATLPFFFVGALKVFRREYSILIYLVLTMGVNIVWPATQGLRFLLPIFPFYLFFVLLGIEWFVRVMEGLDRKAAFAAAAGCVLLAGFFFSRQCLRLALINYRNHREAASGPYTPASRGMFGFIEQNTDPSAVIVFFKPRAMRLVTGRASLEWNNASELPPGQYLCLYRFEDEGSQLSAADVAALQAAGKIKLAFENSDFQLFEIVPAGGG